ncbi:aspartyl protease family protein [Frateuria soli]|uniref:aspartyl protease family protein n=1 Tax=Frateuria soli TaxID=1542730 RepID=UPI001E41FC07|nr:aspartyl protease family protein [Frateuria soli]UGB37217.1 aspartyl protease family protein [Frateuria soli]
MRPFLRLPRILLAAWLLLPALAGAAETDTLLRQLREAHGTAAWARHSALTAEGRLRAEGLAGPWQLAVDLRSGHFAEQARNPVFTVADGQDARGRWHQDFSGMVHPYDSPEALVVAASENWLRRFGFLDPQDGARYRALDDAREGGHRFQRLEAIPYGGRAITLWIDPGTHRLDHATWQTSFLHASRSYTDYRSVEGVWLPFGIRDRTITAGGGLDVDAVVTVQRYRWPDHLPAARLDRPGRPVHDVTMAGGARRATAPMHVEGGILLVDVSIDGHGPLPFILDTGGHAILTADTARRLGFATQGRGSSTGSGPGAMSTAYTKVAHLGIGEADIRDLAFLVMPYPYGMCERGEGREPIAGILGLEIFERFAVTFDYDRQRLVLDPYDHGEPPAPVAGDVLPITFTFDMPLVDGRLDGHAGVFGIDTGNAGLTLLFPQWAGRNGVADRYAHGVPMPTGGVGGRYTAHFAHTRSFALGQARVGDALAMLTQADAGATGNPSEAGNIGQDVLSRYNVHFDYRRGEMVLLPRAKPREPSYATAGFMAGKSPDSPDRYRVGWVLPHGPAAKAGLRKGDAIMAIDGRPSRAIGFGELRDLSQWRREGSVLKLTLGNRRRIEVRLVDVAR